jgi:quinol monooxygenase YgiN
LVSIPLKPGRAAEFLALLNDVFDAMQVENTFVNATALRSTDDPDTIMLFETWLDRENFMSEQMKRPYRAQYEARLAELLRTPREWWFYEPIRSMS